jgi:hypothetical protein
MKIAVIAAGGKTGRAFVESALASGHEVQAGIHIHNPFKEHPRLAVQKCDATQAADVLRLIAGQEAVVSCIGHVRGSAADVQTQATKNILQAMEKLGITRLVSLTGSGVRMPGDKISAIDYLMNVSIALLDPRRIRDGKQHVTLLQASDAEWTVVRVLKLTNGRGNAYRLTPGGPAKIFVARAEAAAAMREVLVQGTYVRQAPVLSKYN